MTEPTHEIRRDVAALLDMSLASIMVSVGIDELEMAREKLRQQLSAAWHQGWMVGFEDGQEPASTTPNPYTRPAPATPAPAGDESNSDNAQ